MVVIKDILEIVKLIVDRDVEVEFNGLDWHVGLSTADSVKVKLKRGDTRVEGRMFKPFEGLELNGDD